MRYGNSFDAIATKPDELPLYLEAKGTETAGASVIVSKGEVNWARNNPNQCVLGILSNVSFLTTGEVDPHSGTFRLLQWNPDEGELSWRSPGICRRAARLLGLRSARNGCHDPIHCEGEPMSAATVQGWIGVVGGLAAAAVAILKYFSYRSKRDRVTVVGQAFTNTVDALSSEAEARKLAAAILLRRFFDGATEQGAAGRPYEREAVAVIAALLRSSASGELQKLLADGLAYAQSLRGSDLQRCNLTDAYLGRRARRTMTSGGESRRVV